jgi:hypothetical protein
MIPAPPTRAKIQRNFLSSCRKMIIDYYLIPDQSSQVKHLGIPYLKKDQKMRKMRTHATTITTTESICLFL